MNERARGLAMAAQIMTELMVGVGLGALGGWGLDKWLGSSPYCLIIGVVLGFAAGVRVMARSARASQTDASTTKDDAK